MKASELLRKARELISHRDQWTQGWYFKAEDGMPLAMGTKELLAHGITPASFCASGALHWTAMTSGGAWEGLTSAAARDALNTAAAARGLLGIEDLNDTRDHADVIAAYDAAIESLESLEADEQAGDSPPT